MGSQRVKIFPYEIVEEYPISDLSKFANHRRLKTFFHKGCTCVSCGIVGTRLIRGRNVRDGSTHLDVYSDDLIPLTVDHIKPRSLGGSNTLENYQPMCATCNSLKGNGLSSTGPHSPRAKGLTRYREGMEIGGMELWRVYKDVRVKPKFLGIIREENYVCANPYCQKPAIVVVGKKVSYFNIGRDLYVKGLAGIPAPVTC